MTLTRNVPRDVSSRSTTALAPADNRSQSASVTNDSCQTVISDSQAKMDLYVIRNGNQAKVDSGVTQNESLAKVDSCVMSSDSQTKVDSGVTLNDSLAKVDSGVMSNDSQARVELDVALNDNLANVDVGIAWNDNSSETVSFVIPKNVDFSEMDSSDRHPEMESSVSKDVVFPEMDTVTDSQCEVDDDLSTDVDSCVSLNDRLTGVDIAVSHSDCSSSMLRLDFTAVSPAKVVSQHETDLSCDSQNESVSAVNLLTMDTPVSRSGSELVELNDTRNDSLIDSSVNSALNMESSLCNDNLLKITQVYSCCGTPADDQVNTDLTLMWNDKASVTSDVREFCVIEKPVDTASVLANVSNMDTVVMLSHTDCSLNLHHDKSDIEMADDTSSATVDTRGLESFVSDTVTVKESSSEVISNLSQPSITTPLDSLVSEIADTSDVQLDGSQPMMDLSSSFIDSSFAMNVGNAGNSVCVTTNSTSRKQVDTEAGQVIWIDDDDEDDGDDNDGDYNSDYMCAGELGKRQCSNVGSYAELSVSEDSDDNGQPPGEHRSKHSTEWSNSTKNTRQNILRTRQVERL